MLNEEIKKKVFIRNVRKGAMIKLLADTFEVIQLDAAKDKQLSRCVLRKRCSENT